MSVSANPNGSLLCLACGLCCNGVLHARTIVKPNEIETVCALGLMIETNDDQPGFRQPCLLYRQQCCSVYPNHPPTCKAYQCKLLKNFLAGPLTLEQGAQTIHRARELLAAVIAQLPPGHTFDQLRQEMDQDRDSGRGVFGSAELRRQNAEFLLTVAKLAVYPRKHFGKPRDREIK
jgi:uncharacterized protein